MKKTSLLTLSLIALVSLAAETASAACMNKFVSRTERPLQIVTLLTGKLTFQEAQDLARDIQARKLPPVEWVDEAGKSVARQYGELKVMRPMPVGCDGKPSGVVVVASFASGIIPSKKMLIKFTPEVTVTFEQQSD